MTERILEKLDVLEENEKIIAAIRAKVCEVEALGKVRKKTLFGSPQVENQQQIKRRKTSSHLKEKKKSLITPLPFDDHGEFEGTIAPSTAETATENTENKSNDLKKSKMHLSFEYNPKPRSDFEESDLRPPVFATDISNEESTSTEIKEQDLNLESSFDEESQRSWKPQEICFKPSPAGISSRELEQRQLIISEFCLELQVGKPASSTGFHDSEYAMPLNILSSQPRHLCKISAECPKLPPKPFYQSNAGKEKVFPPFTDQNESRAKKSMMSTDGSADAIKEGRKYPPEVNDLITKESKPTRNDEPRTPRPVKQTILFPLSCEHILKNPNVKTIAPAPEVTVLYSMEESHTNPIIFHDATYVRTWFLKKRFTPFLMTTKKMNVVLQKNCDRSKALRNNEPTDIFKPQRSKLVGLQKLAQKSLGKKQKSRRKEQKKNHDSLALAKRFLKTHYDLSQIVPILTNISAGYFDKDVTQKKTVKSDRFERTFSKAKQAPKRHFTALPMKYDSKPLKNILEIYKLNNVTPVDNLLTWKVNESQDLFMQKYLKPVRTKLQDHGRNSNPAINVLLDTIRSQQSKINQHY
ncbi:uncharacterized protein C1orf141 homolog [Meriones unguiculatus]|uniref:uncharacterized protein C1orf141 homolog n=1 Tax=Meriones unguiculatus TaxID=10047 RepID=UPI000B4F9FE5|nr:uncharacterized protein C1orf141 homolog [Meriones unguiculatus]